MAFKFIAFATLVAAASAGLLPAAPQDYHLAHAAPKAHNHEAPLPYAARVAKVLTKSYEPEPYDHNPQYSYSYEVHDTHSGDIKSQQETRNGDVVKGSYSFIEADGSRRIVHYTADHHGFNAVVENQPTQHVLAKHVEPAYAKIALPAAHAPVSHQHATPIVESSPKTSHGYAAPAVSHSYHH